MLSRFRSAQPYPLFCVPWPDFLYGTRPAHAQTVCQCHLRGAEFANPNSRWTGYLYVSNRYGHFNQ